MTQTKRLELSWIGKEDRPQLEPHTLLEDPRLSYGKRVSNDDIFDNLLIQGDNLPALKALEREFAGKVKCVFIDPPYNTGSAFQQYDDGLAHSIWLSLMRARLEVIHRLLDEDGSLWITIDDNEVHYLKVLCDEVFGRLNFVGTLVLESNPKGRQLDRFFAGSHEYLLCYGKQIHKTAIEPGSTDEVDFADFPERDADGRFRYLPLRNTNKRFNPQTARSMYFPVYFDPHSHVISVDEVIGWRKILPVFGDGSPAVWRWSRDKIRNTWKALSVRTVQRRATGKEELDLFQRDYCPDDRTKKLRSIWLATAIGSTDHAKAEAKALASDHVFATPKPEKLLARVIECATNRGDLVLDSFLGSGTTAAVAHKLGRRWIGIELGEHALTHCVPRLQKVAAGEDPGGITEAAGWKGGGGFRFFRLAPSLHEKDQWGNRIVSKQYKPEMLAEAMCELEGFRYAPDREVFWNHGRSTERDFLYVTTQNVSPDELRFLSEQVGPERTLLICCGAFRGEADFPNLTLKQIPQAVLARCEWGKADHRPQVTEQAPVVAVEEEVAESPTRRRPKTKAGGRQKQVGPAQVLARPADSAPEIVVHVPMRKEG